MLLRKLFLTSLLALSGRRRARELVKRASLEQVTDFGSNPTGTLMYIYVPENLASSPPIVVALHECTVTAEGYYESTPYPQLAEKYGFIVIYPQSPYSGTCWDVSSAASLTHDGGADSNSIANMVTYTIAQYDADASRVFCTGSSSGAMMTNVMAATYPELFAAATVYSGVPAGCFYTGTVDGWNTTCAEGLSIHTQQVWADTAFAMYPGYTGSRPRMMIFHGSADTTLYPPNFNETLKQWTGVFGLPFTPDQILANTPSTVYTEYIYGSDVVGIYGQGVGHTVPVMGDQDMAWFGISGAVSSSSSTATSGPTSTSSGSGGPACTAAHWAQCGGEGFTGCTTCASGYTCQEANAYYSQCL